MMAESMTLQGLFVVLLTIGAKESWSAARGALSEDSSTGTWLIAFAIVALVISVILVIWSFAKHSRSENLLRQKVSELTITGKQLRREIDDTRTALLQILQSIINTEPPDKDVLEVEAQQILTLSELSQRLPAS